MQRLLVYGPRQAAFEEAPDPVCGPDDVLVRALNTAISPGTELRVYRAIPVDDAGQFLHETVPFVLPTENGYSMVGMVEQAGPQVKNVTLGQRVFLPATHRSRVAMAAERVTVLPDAVTSETAVFLSILEVAHLGLRRGTPQPGEYVAILGLGVIGLGMLAFATRFGLRTVAIDPNPARLELARSMGAHLAISPQEPDCVKRVQDYCGGRGPDLVLEAASSWEAVRTGLQIAAPEARLVLVSRHTQRPEFNPAGHPFLGKKLTILTSYGYPADGHRWDRRNSQRFTLELLARGELPIEPMITHRYHWRELPEVYRRLDAGELSMVGVVLDWTS